jgi:subtilisin family serine protease
MEEDPMGPRPVRTGFTMLVVTSLFLSAATVTLAVDPPDDLTVTPLTADEVIEADKSRSGQLAQTDPALLGRTDGQRINVLVKFDYDPVASYAGDTAGLAATSPEVTGKSLKANARAVQAYLAHIEKKEQRISGDIQATVAGAQIRASFRVAYGGVAMSLPANQVGNLMKVDGVAAVQKDDLRQPQTDASPEFLGAPDVWAQLGGQPTAGEGVIVGVLDTGIWPEHPSWEDPGIDHPGGTFGCEFGDGTDPLLGDGFTCNDKLIGAYARTDTYMAVIGAIDGEFCNNTTDECSARDAEGHGTHTSSTAAGSPVEEALLYGVDRGPISGMAPGAHVIMYRVCMDQGCFGSDSVSAVEQAITDGVDVLNFSISGGSSAFTDPVELAFLDAYAAGILVNASAGNAGPAVGTANHAGPWTNTIAASTSDRHFVADLTITAGGDSFAVQGATITAGISTPTEVIRGTDVPGYDVPGDDPGAPDDEEACLGPLPAGSVTGKIVVCQRIVGARVDKSYNVLQGGAVGMILYNGTPNLGVNTDNHWVPSIHIEHNGPAGEHPLVTFLAAHSGETATFTSGVATTVVGDVMTSFSSRGPVGDFLKPDVTAPGIQILAGHTPEPIGTVNGPPGELFQAIAGTSMSSPHAAGVSALVKAVHPDWTPGQIKSALMTSSLQSVLKQDGVTPATPFDRGAGAIRANRAAGPTVTFDVDAGDYFASASDPLGRLHLNLPSIYSNPMPGAVATDRTFTNVSGSSQTFNVVVNAPAGVTIDVNPNHFTVAAGATQKIKIVISAAQVANGTYFGQITLDATGPAVDAVIPVAFNKTQGNISMQHDCDPLTIDVGETTDCEATIQNLAPVSAAAQLTVTGPKSRQLEITSFDAPAKKNGPNGFMWKGTLTPALAPTVDSVEPGETPFGGYVPLTGITPVPGMGDETIVNFIGLPAFKFGSETYTRIGATSNGYAVVGGGTGADVEFDPPDDLPDAARPNNVLAPFWTDLNFADGGALRAAIASSGGMSWLILDWAAVPEFGTGGAVTNTFQIWIQLGATEDISYAYGEINGDGTAEGLIVGAENRDGTSGATFDTVPAEGDQLVVLTSPPTPGGSQTIGYTAVGNVSGTWTLRAAASSSVTTGTTIDEVNVLVE